MRRLRGAIIAVVVAMTALTGILVAGQLAVEPDEPAALADLGRQELVAGVENQVAILEEEARIAAEAEALRLAEEARIAAEAEAARVAEEARIAAEAAAAEAAAAEAAEAARRAANQPTNDSGIENSAYTGSYYNPSFESTRKCIVRKESGGNYGIVSSNGSYHGAYQFSRSTGDTAAQKMGRPDLVGTPASRWSRYEQDQAFWITWNHGGGRGNWPTASGC